MTGTYVGPALICLAAATTLVSCGEKLDAPGSIGSNLENCDDITYETVAKPIVETYCTRCHSSDVTGTARRGAPATVNFDTYDALRPNAGRALRRIEQGTMPPDGERPTPEEAAMMRCWVEGGSVRE